MSLYYTTLLGIKTHQIFFIITWTKWSNFNKFWYKYSWYNWPSNGCLVSHLTHCLFLHYPGKENQQNIAFLTTMVSLLNQNNTQNTYFVYIFIVLANSFFVIVHFLKSLPIKMFEMLAHEHGLGSETLSSFVDSSVDNVLLQTNPDFTSRFLNSLIFMNVRAI